MTSAALQIKRLQNRVFLLFSKNLSRATFKRKSRKDRRTGWHSVESTPQNHLKRELSLPLVSLLLWPAFLAGTVPTDEPIQRQQRRRTEIPRQRLHERVFSGMKEKPTSEEATQFLLTLLNQRASWVQLGVGR